MKYSIKEATFIDLADIARIHVRSWQQTYIGLVPQDYLDSMSVSTFQKKWEGIFQGNISENKNLYIAYDNDEAAGFISFGHNRDKHKDGWGEIYALYLLKQSWGKSIGYALFEKTRQKLLNDGINNAYLWVLDTNENALSAYKKWGGVMDETSTLNTKIGGLDVKEMMINFDLNARQVIAIKQNA
jgi:GNAT superfamily N-acetyltransferase